MSFQSVIISYQLNHFIASDKSKKGQYIVREGTSGDTFYIISDGDVKVTKKSAGKEEEIRTLTKGDYFGEQVSSRAGLVWRILNGNEDEIIRWMQTFTKL